MRQYEGFFDALFFTNCQFGSVQCSDMRLAIPVTEIYLLRGHPLEFAGYGPFAGQFVFEGATYSRRTVIEHIGDPRKTGKFRAPYDVIDEIPHTDQIYSEELLDFVFEGMQVFPSAWIDDWTIKARTFKLLVDD